MGSFLESWSLFRDTYLAAIASGVLLSVVGVIVVGRNQIFLAAAVAQAALLGVAINHILGLSHATWMAVGFSVVTALFASRREKRGGVSAEETTGWIFLLAASLTILVLARRPISLKEVQAMMSSSLMGATARDVVVFGAMAVAALLAGALLKRRLVLLLTDPTMAAAVGMKVGLWTLTAAAVLGLSTGLSLKTSGLLFTFACLVLPTLIARNIARESATLFLLAPTVAAVSVLLGLLVSHQMDFPPGQVVTALMALGLAGAWLFRDLRARMVGY